MNLDGRKVSLVRMHTSTHIQGVGSVGPVLDKNSGKVLGSINMTVVPHGILVSFGNGKVEAVISSGNIVSYELTPDKNATLNETNSKATSKA